MEAADIFTTGLNDVIVSQYQDCTLFLIVKREKLFSHHKLRTFDRVAQYTLISALMSFSASKLHDSSDESGEKKWKDTIIGHQSAHFPPDQ